MKNFQLTLLSLCLTLPIAHAADLAGTAPFQFRYVEELSDLPSATDEHLSKAHGGFAVDSRTGEVFFGLKGAGVIWMSNDLKHILDIGNKVSKSFDQMSWIYSITAKLDKYDTA